jgi:hypothetical protein
MKKYPAVLSPFSGDSPNSKGKNIPQILRAFAAISAIAPLFLPGDFVKIN